MTTDANESNTSKAREDLRFVPRNRRTRNVVTDGAETPKIFYSFQSAARVGNLQECRDDWAIEDYLALQ